MKRILPLLNLIALVVLLSSIAPLYAEGNDAKLVNSHSILYRLTLEEPSYFAIGAGTRKWGQSNSFLTDPDNQAKFRLALRMPILPLTEHGDGVYFSFTEEALWNPFDGRTAALDNRYTPEFIGWWTNGVGRGVPWYRPAFGVSYSHQSNGLMGDVSRSWNRAMLRAVFGDSRQHPILLTVKGWAPFAVDYRMPDLDSYVGQAEVLLIWQPLLERNGQGADVLGVSLKSGLTVDKRTFSNLETTLLFNPATLFDWNIPTMPTLMLQYFVGRGESILDYKRDTHSLRIGLTVLDR